MGTHEMNFIVGVEQIDLGLGLSASDKQKIFSPIKKQLTNDVFSEKVKNEVENLARAFDNCILDSSNFCIDKIEFTLTVGTGGEISILTVFEAGISLGTGIKVTLKKIKS